jgi:hypothetical protein
MVKAKVARMYSLETYGGAELYLRPLLTLALDDVRDLLRAPNALSPAKEPLARTHLREGLHVCSLEPVWTLC